MSFAILLLSACWEGNQKDMPPASGHSGDIYLVMDSSQWKGLLGEVVDSLFRIEMTGLPRKEAIFNMRWIDPRKLNFVLKGRRNLIFVVTFDKPPLGVRKINNLLTPKSLSMIKKNPKKHATAISDVYAKGQEVMYLYGNTEEDIIAAIRNKGAHLINHFDKREKARLLAALFKAGQVKGVSKWLQENFECTINIPFGYKLVEHQEDFLWVRQINPQDDQNIFIARSSYTSQSQFEKDSLIAFRNRICKKYLFEDPDVADSYLVTETTIPFVPVTTQRIKFNNQYTIKMSGLWRANNFSMGGPFVGYALVDESKRNFYYVEGFTFSPGKDQREIIRVLDVILTTFKTNTTAR